MESNQDAASLFLLSVAYGALFIAFRRNFDSPLTWEFGTIAQNILAGKGFSMGYFGPLAPTSIKAPFYPFFLAGVYDLFGTGPVAYLFVQVIQLIVFGSVSIVMYFIAKELFDRKIGIIASVLFILYPEYAYTVTVIQPIIFTTLWISVLVFLLVRFSDNPSQKMAILIGLVIGGGALTRSTILFYAPFAALWMLYVVEREYGIGKAIVLVSTATLTSIVAISPWVIRNFTVHKKVVLVQSMGYAFWRGNTPPAIHTGIANGKPLARSRYPELETMGNTEADSFLLHRGIEYVVLNPVEFLSGILIKAKTFWWFPIAAADTSSLGPALLTLRKIGFAPVVLAAAAGLVVTRNKWRELFPVYLLFFAFTLGFSVFFARPRYRIPTVQPYLFIFSAAFMNQIFDKYLPDCRDV